MNYDLRLYYCFLSIFFFSFPAAAAALCCLSDASVSRFLFILFSSSHFSALSSSSPSYISLIYSPLNLCLSVPDEHSDTIVDGSGKTTTTTMLFSTKLPHNFSLDSDTFRLLKPVLN